MSENTAFPVTRDRIPAVLRTAGITATPQRIEIAAVLMERPQHLSAEQVLTRLQSDDSAVSKATVYNTLKLFAERGLVREVMVDATRVFFDSNTGPHHHFYNVDDGELMDFEVGSHDFGDLPTPPEGTEAVSVDLVIRVRNLPAKDD